jgi:hypothetical protein
MITDKDRIDFLQRCIEEGEVTSFIFTEDVRTQIDREMAKAGDWDFPDLYCECGTGFTHWDIEYLDCAHSTEPVWNPGSQSESWIAWYTCSECGEEIEVEEGT